MSLLKNPPRRWSLLAMAGLLVALFCAGCVESYSGSRLELTIQPNGLESSVLILPTPGLRPGDPGYFSHYELHAVFVGGGMARLNSFLIQPVLHADNPCLQFTPDEYCIDVPDQPCDAYVNMERYRPLESILGVVSLATTRPADATELDTWTDDASDFVHWPGYDFMAWPSALFEDATLSDPLARLARENLIQEAVEDFCGHLPKRYYLGNGAQLTFPLRGSLLGVLDTNDPRTGSPIGGVTLWVPGKLADMTELLVIKERDPKRVAARNPDNVSRTDLLPSDDSQVFLSGRSDEVLGFLRRDMYRGVTRVLLENPFGLPITMTVTVFEDIDEDPIEL